MLRILDDADDFCVPRLSNGFMSCLVPPPKYSDAPKATEIVSFRHLYHQTLALTVLKLDASSFAIEVEKTGTVRDLKLAVEAAFRYLPKKGPRSVSWEHVWGQFCLCHEGQKLLNDRDYLGMIGIKDGDQLQFIHHASYCLQLVKVQPILEDPDSEDECGNSDGSSDKHQNNNKDDDTHLGTSRASKDKHDGDVISHYDYKLTHMLRGWLSYRKLGYQTGVDQRISLPRSSNNILGSLKNRLRFSRNKHCWLRKENLMGK